MAEMRERNSDDPGRASPLDFRALFDNLPNAYVIVDRGLEIVHANAKYLQATMTTLDDIVGQRIFDVFPESGQRRRRFEAAFRKAFDGEENVVPFQQYGIRRPAAAGDGYAALYWSCTHTPIRDADGRTAFVIQHAQDVTDLYHLREELSQQTDDANHRLQGGILDRATRVEALNEDLVREQDRLRLLSEAMAAMPAARERDELIEIVCSTARRISEAEGAAFVIRDGDACHYLHEDARQPLWQGQRFPIGDCLAGRAMSRNETTVVADVCDDPRVDLARYEPTFVRSLAFVPIGKPAASAALAIYWSQPRVVDSLDVARLETLAIAAGAALKSVEHLASLKDADQRKDEFLAVLAHELRNPLAPLHNGLELIRIGSDAESLSNIRQMMSRQLKHLVRLTDDLLDLSRISRNQLMLRRAPIDIAQVIGAAVEATRPTIEAECHRLTIALPHEQVLIDADGARLAQVISNLLINSAKYTPRGGRIDLAANLVEGRLRIEVRDDGKGITVDDLPSIFDMFTRSGDSFKYAPDGLGVGLALVKAIVEMHGGTVVAKSAGRDSGSTFTVTLDPLPRESADGKLAGQSLLIGGRSTRRRVLVVDDNTDAAQSMALLLETLGHEVMTAQDGVAAIAAAEAFLPDVVFMDIGLPKLDGYEATRRLRATPWGRTATVVALTGWGQPSDKQRSREAGCDLHLVKPVRLADITDLLGKLE
jgi:PAS domain S-box-containing protein